MRSREVDAVLGTTAYDKILDAIDEALKGHHTLTLADTDLLPEVETKRLVTTGGHFAYLKIAEGCDKHCTYCIIPKIREISGVCRWSSSCQKQNIWQNKG